MLLGNENKSNQEDFISLDQDQYIKNTISTFEKSFKYPFKKMDFPLPISFIPTKNNCTTTDVQIKETKTSFCNLHYRSIIGIPLYVSCCTRPENCFAINNLAKFDNNPGLIRFSALLHFIGFLKIFPSKGLRFYTNVESSLLFQLLKDNNIQISEDTIVTFTDSLCINCVDTGRSTGGNLSLTQGCANNYSSRCCYMHEDKSFENISV